MNQARHTPYPEINALIERELIVRDGKAFKDPAGNTLFSEGQDGRLYVYPARGNKQVEYVPPLHRDEAYRDRLKTNDATHDTALLYFNTPHGYHPGHTSLGINQREGREKPQHSEFNFVTDMHGTRAMRFMGRVLLYGGIGIIGTDISNIAPENSLWNVVIGGGAGALVAVTVPFPGLLKEEEFAAKHALGISITAAQSEVLKTDLLLQKLNPPSYSLLNVGKGVNCTLHDIMALEEIGIHRKELLAYKQGWAVISPGALERFITPMREGDPITLTIQAQDQADAKMELRSQRVGEREYLALDVLSGPYTAAEGIKMLEEVNIKLIGARFYREGAELQPGVQLQLTVEPKDKTLINKVISSSITR